MAIEKELSDTCPKINKADDDLRSSSYEERLKLIEEEANSLYAFCLKKGFSNGEMNVCISKLYGPKKSLSARTMEDSRRSLIYVALLVAVVGMVYASPTSSNLVTVHYKLFMIKFIMPFWNFGELWNEDCLVYNQWLPHKEEIIDAKACKFCLNIVKLNNNTFDRLKDAKKADIQKHYVMHHQPVIVEDSMKDWKTEPLTMEKIAELYQTNPLLSTSMGSCVYETSVGFNETFYDFITAYVDKKLPQKWHANWENCDPKSAKILRKYYSRPYYVPDMAQAGTFNALVVAKGEQPGNLFKLLLEGSQGRWLTVLSGSIKGHFSPFYTQCIEEFGCKITEFELFAGQSVFFFPTFWDFEYEVTGKEMTIAVTSSLLWDI